MFETLVDEVIVSVQKVIEADIKNRAERKEQVRITEEFFNQHRAELKEFLDKQLKTLLFTRCDVEFLKSHIKYSARPYIKSYKDKDNARKEMGWHGDSQLGKFLEGRIEHLLAFEKDEIIIQKVQNYLTENEALLTEDEIKEIIEQKAQAYASDKKLDLNKEEKNESIDQKKEIEQKEAMEEIYEELKNFLKSKAIILTNRWIEAYPSHKNEENLPPLNVEESLSQQQKKQKKQQKFHAKSCDFVMFSKVIEPIDARLRIYVQDRFDNLITLKSQLPKVGYELKFEAEQNKSAEIIDRTGKALPAKIQFVNNSIRKNSEQAKVLEKVTLIVEQYNTMHDLRHILYNKDQNFHQHEKKALFTSAFMKPENQALLDKDIPWKLRNILISIGNILTGGLLSKAIIGKYRLLLWPSEQNLVKEMISDRPSENFELLTKEKDTHNVLKPRSRSR